ncbi:hypothetical protein CCR82_13390 [Halochromatium salexigens]|uniref:Uncharacterized protein n=1 Tax=Halochromatium salexigens TaxID=49447 RepID=A0AAJ0XGG3_HALSE|nr:hypothetical protein [Halochromatium salexigens]
MDSCLAELAGVHQQYAAPARSRSVQLQAAEKHIAALVNQAYGLSADEIELMWKTAPPRMPIGH